MAAGSAKSAASSGTAATSRARSDEGPSTKDLEADIQRLREDIAQLTKDIRGAGEAQFKSARRAATDKVEGWKAEGEAKLDDLRESARDMEQELTRTVREKPVTSLAVAAGVGFVLALLARR